MRLGKFRRCKRYIVVLATTAILTGIGAKPPITTQLWGHQWQICRGVITTGARAETVTTARVILTSKFDNYLDQKISNIRIKLNFQVPLYLLDNKFASFLLKLHIVIALFRRLTSRQIPHSSWAEPGRHLWFSSFMSKQTPQLSQWNERSPWTLHNAK